MTRENNKPIDQAFVLCAGMGSRMRPYTDEKPKPMVEVMGKPLIQHTINHLRQTGINHIGINSYYKAEVIKDHMTRFEPDVFISHEDELLDTGGGLKKALPQMKDADFFIINGDAYWIDAPEINTLEFMQSHWAPDKMDILLLLQDINTMPDDQAVGDYDLTPDGRAVRSLDKTGRYMFTSIRINTPRIFDTAPDGPFSYLKLMDEAQARGRLYGVVNPGEWIHISTPKDLDDLNARLIARPAKPS